MLYRTPDADLDPLAGLLDELDGLRARLHHGLDQPRPWTQLIRRQEQADAWASSVRIEGFAVDEDRSLQIVESRSRADETFAGEAAFRHYADAMEHVAVLAVDPLFEWSDRVILDLHFEVCRFQRTSTPGLVRRSAVFVTGATGTAFTGPRAALVPELLGELVLDLARNEGKIHPAVAGAMAHLNLVSIHPFQDGNGRISRIVQSLVLARDGLLAPEFGSIEQSLAADTAGYYQALQRVQKGGLNPSNDPTSWVEFCLRAHVSQAKLRLQRVQASADRWSRLEDLISERGWDERLVIALEQALHAGADRSTYAAEAGIALPTASIDLRRLLDAGYLIKVGRGRSTRYEASQGLRETVARD